MKEYNDELTALAWVSKTMLPRDSHRVALTVYERDSLTVMYFRKKASWNNLGHIFIQIPNNIPSWMECGLKWNS